MSEYINFIPTYCTMSKIIYNRNVQFNIILDDVCGRVAHGPAEGVILSGTFCKWNR